MGQYRCAYEVLIGCKSIENLYLLGLCCVSLELWSEAETALTQGRVGAVWSLTHVVNGAYGLTLLGSVYRVLLQTDRAIACYRAALQLNPFLWSATSGLCALGVTEDPTIPTAAPPPSSSSKPKASTSSFSAAETPVSPHFLTPVSSVAVRAMLQQQHHHPHDDEVAASEREWLQRLQPLAQALWHLKGYRLPEAISALEKADVKQRQSGWGRTLLATVYAERGDYVDAVREFEVARRKEPWLLEGVEVHSTALWHLKRDSQLSHLAHQCVHLSRTAPQTWCAVGNVMSLLREHDAALRFFKRAMQLQPSFVYAYTLCGHEHVANDDLEQATADFRQALQRDPRHYKAWYGLGMIYYRTQRYALAEYHFLQALQIYPRSSALHMYLGMVKSKMRLYESALQCLDTSIACNPRNVLAKSLNCQVIIARGDYQRGLAMVEEMLQIAPREAFLHFLKASVCAKRGEMQLALVHYQFALDLDSRNSSVIKSRMDRIVSGANPLLSELDVNQDEPEDEFEVM